MITTNQLDEWLCDAMHPTADFIATARTAPPALIAEVRRLREQLRAYQVEDLRRKMIAWSMKWVDSRVCWSTELAARIWGCPEWRDDDVAKPDAQRIVEFGRSIDAWITDDGKVVTIAEWEAMLEKKT